MENGNHDPSSQKLTRLFLGLASLFFCLCVFLAAAWYLTWKSGELDIENLSTNEVQTLVEQFVEKVPSVLRYAFFEPRIGYTLQPNSELSTWGDTFTSNELGYRTDSVKKGENTFRVLFLGDSWTYGQGVSEQESFPFQFAVVANSHTDTGKAITAWTLALPGYNTINQLAALDAFIDQIQPDAVVMCPTGNDIDGTLGVSSGGRAVAQRRSEWRELYLQRFFISDSHLNRTLWQDTFSAISQTVERLKERDLPFFVFTLFGGYEPFVHHHMSRAKVGAPYTIVPLEFFKGKWKNTGQYGHGTPEVYTVFAKIIYQMFEQELGWPPLPEKVKTGDGSEIRVFSDPPPGDWEAETRAFLRTTGRNFDDFNPGTQHARLQIKSGVDRETGAASSNPAVVMLQRRSGSTSLRLELERLPEARYLYPLDVTVTIPSSSGGASVDARLFEEGQETQTIEIDIPTGIEPDSGIDVIIETPRSALDEHFVARSFYITRIEQR